MEPQLHHVRPAAVPQPATAVQLPRVPPVEAAALQPQLQEWPTFNSSSDSDDERVETHYSQAAGPSSFRCPICDEKFSSIQDRIEHVDKVHKETSNIIDKHVDKVHDETRNIIDKHVDNIHKETSYIISDNELKLAATNYQPEKPPCNIFFMFRSAVLPLYQEKFPGLDIKERTKLIADQWNSLKVDNPNVLSLIHI